MLRSEHPDSHELRTVSARIRAGEPSSRALLGVGGPDWRVLAAAWGVAEESGAPLVPVLDRLSLGLRDLARLNERRAVLLAAPRATIRLVAALPALAMVLALLLGFDPIPVLLSPAGGLLLVAGLTLLGLGIAWARHLTARVERADRVVGWACELVWIGLGGGGPPGPAMRITADRAARAGADWVRLADLRRDGPVARVLAASARNGIAAGPLLLAEAGSARARAHAELERAAERLGILVLIPVGVCVLPAFVLLGVVPVLLTILGGVVAAP